MTDGKFVVIFRSYRSDGDDAEYHAAADATEEAVSTIPGFVEMKTFTAADGEHVTIGMFETEEGYEAWKTHPIHNAAQARAQSEFYDAYDLTVGDIRFRRRWQREDGIPEL